MNEKEIYEQWIENYLVPQMANDASKIPELFADEGVYWYGPYFEPRKGVDAIFEHHRNALSHQENIKYTWKILASNDEFALAWFDLTLKDLAENEPSAYQGIFKITLDEHGTCTLFEEWYNFTNI